MARTTPIRISENDKKEYARLVRNARSKIRRTLKNHNVNLENEVSLPKNIGEFESRDEFNKWKNEVSSFTNRSNQRYQFVTNKHKMTLSKSEIHHIEVKRRREQHFAREEIKRVKDLKVKQDGKEFATVEQRTLHFSESDVTGVTVPRDFDFEKVVSKSHLNQILDVGERRQDPKYYDQRKEKMKDNFINGIIDSFDSESDELVERLKKMSASDFYLLYLTNEEFDFDELYYKDGEAAGLTNEPEQIDKLMTILDSYDVDIRNPDLDGF